MKKRFLFVFCITLTVFLTVTFYLLFFYNITEKRYNKIMCYYVTRNLTDGLDSFNERVAAIRDFVHENVLPIHGYHNRLDTSAIEKLTSGIGWCDQQARVFMQLARSVGITSRLLFLLDERGSSPHAVAEALAPDGRWIIVDPQYSLNLVNKDGDFATRADIREDLSVVADNKRVKLRAAFEARWADTAYLSIYSNTPIYVTTKKGVEFDFLKFVPLRAIMPIANIINRRYLNQINPHAKDIYESGMARARTLHLLGYYEESGNLYGEIIANSGNLPLTRKAEFYNALLLKDRGRYNEARGYIANTIGKDRENRYRIYLIGLRARISEKMGEKEEAEKDLQSIEYELGV